MSQKTLADRIGMPIGHLMKLERGLTALTEDKVKAIASVLGISSNDIQQPERITGEGYITAKGSVSDDIITRRRDPNISLRPVIDLFCGVGGFSTGFEMTGEFEIVAGLDLLGDRLETFCQNHDAAVGLGGDIRGISSSQIFDNTPRPFVVIGGPPCQGFSSIRPFRNVEWNDHRNNLGEEFFRIVSLTLPEWLVFENVVGLVTHDKGRTLSSLIEAFESLGYRTEARVINGAFHGLPQRRERLIIVGSLRGKAFDWPVPTHDHKHRSMAGQSKLLIVPNDPLFGKTQRALSVMDAIDDLPAVASGQKSSSYASLPKNRFQEIMRNESETLSLHEATAHSPEMLNIIRHSGSSISALPKGMVTSGFSSCYSRLAADDPANTITVNFVHPASNRCIHPFQDRALTPREGARLQSFPDTFIFKGSRSQVVKQIGNAVPPLIGRLIAEAILDAD